MISYKKFSGYEASIYRSDFSRLSNLSMLAEIILTHAWSPIVWKNNYAKTENFEFSDFLALDFDEPGDETLEDVNRALCDHKRILATTRSHQKVKNGLLCDRYRLIIPWSKRITSYEEYKFNYKLVLKRFPWADNQCSDGARFFFPSEKIVFIDRESPYNWDTSEIKIDPIITPTLKINFTPDGKIPSWCLNFLNNGAVYNGSRNLKVYAVARELFRQGFLEADTRRLLMRAPIDWDGVALEAILRNAKEKENKCSH